MIRMSLASLLLVGCGVQDSTRLSRLSEPDWCALSSEPDGVTSADVCAVLAQAAAASQGGDLMVCEAELAVCLQANETNPPIALTCVGFAPEVGCDATVGDYRACTAADRADYVRQATLACTEDGVRDVQPFLAAPRPAACEPLLASECVTL